MPYSLSGLPSLLDKVVAHSHGLMLAYDHMDHEPSLHVSLTRPIILRKHEERSFAEEVLQAVKSLSLPRYAAKTNTDSPWLSLDLFVYQAIPLSVYFYAWS